MSLDLADPSVRNETDTLNSPPEASPPKRRSRAKDHGGQLPDATDTNPSSPQDEQALGSPPPIEAAGTAPPTSEGDSPQPVVDPATSATAGLEDSSQGLSHEEKRQRRQEQRQARAAQTALRMQGVQAAKERAVTGRAMLEKKRVTAQGVVHEEALELWTPQIFALCSRELAGALTNINLVTVAGAARLSAEESDERISELRTTVEGFLDLATKRAQTALADYVLATRDGKYQLAGKPAGTLVVPVNHRVAHDLIAAIANLDRAMQYAKSLSIVGPRVGEFTTVLVDAPAAPRKPKKGRTTAGDEGTQDTGDTALAPDTQREKVTRRIQGVDYDATVAAAKKQLNRLFNSIGAKASLVIRGLKDGQAALANSEPASGDDGRASSASDGAEPMHTQSSGQAADALAVAS